MMLAGRRRTSLWCEILLFLLLGGASAQKLTATVGSEVTLRCSYDARYHGRLWACWSKGLLPSRGCGNLVMQTDGTSVIDRLSERYLLLGNLGWGDLSLTIRQLQETDSGTYGCRVEIPGWFNDEKTYVTLTVVPTRPNPLKVSTREVNERTVTVAWSAVFDGGRPIIRYSLEIKDEQLSWDTAKRTEVSNPRSSLNQLTVMDLHPAKTYHVRMFAANSVGRSGASNVLTVTTSEAAPEGPPLDLQLEGLTPNSIRVTWRPPQPELRNGLLLTYSISYREYDPTVKNFRGWRHLRVSATREASSVVLRNLNPSTKYGVMVQALTNAGIGPAATAPLCSTLDEVVQSSPVPTTNSTTAPVTRRADGPTQSTTAPTTSTDEPYATSWEESSTTAQQPTGVPPDPPVLELKEAKGSTISLVWTSAFEGDSPITGYYLESKTTNASWDNTKTAVDFSANQTEATLIEMNPATYDIRMFAENSAGTSNASNVLTITTGEADMESEAFGTTVSTDTQAAASAGMSQNNLLAGVMVPVVLGVLAVATLAAWKLKRE
ncbi:cell adhesion molecule DSCAML1-like [Nelusetta ayraudi]|uniref:cell adhesion molecule DSCAML1-like n=1 Tax=Nelusetta ayraudi TaxID=303726 RepID=UPI003F70A269